MNLFWSNTIWYLALLASSILTINITNKRTLNRKFTSAFHCGVLGFTYWLEIFLLLIFNAYTYYPMLTPWDPFQDAVLGNIFSQISVSSTAVLCCVLGLGSRYSFLFAGIYFLIDLLFSYLGIYEHYWYRSIYTFFGFLVYIWIVKRWYAIFTKVPNEQHKFFSVWSQGEKIKKIIYPITLFFAVFAVAANTLITTQKVAGLQIFAGGFYIDASKDHTSTSILYTSVLTVIMMLLYRLKCNRVYHVVALLILFACQFVLYNIGIHNVIPGWFVFATTIDILGFYYWTGLLDNMLRSLQSP